MPLNALSLFSGIGGFELGFQRADVPVHWVGHSEIDHFAERIYSSHFKNPNYGDIRSIEPRKLPKLDLITGGFPCQSFSTAGKRAGLDDARGQLFFEVIRLLRNAQPTFFLLENVKGLLSHQRGATFLAVLQNLTELGYRVSWALMDSADYGVPQHRERVYLLGTHRKEPAAKILPFPLTSTSPLGAGSPEETHRPVCRPLSRHLRPTVRRFKAACEPWYTLTASDVHGVTVGKRIRKLTPLEYERLQGFPDEWTKYGVKNDVKDGQQCVMSDFQRYKVLGNAVTVNVVAAVAQEVFSGCSQVPDV